MPRVKLTERWAETIRVESRQEYRDTELRGFFCRVSPEGSRAWGVVYSVRGSSKQIRHTIGRWPQWSAAGARAEAKRILLEASQGIASTKQHADTVETIARSWLDLHVRPNLRSAAEYERWIEVDVIPVWGSRLASSITRREVIAFLDRIVERGSPSSATRILDVISSMFGWAVDRERIDANPCLRVKDPVPNVPRERYLSEDEIVELWRVLDTRGTPAPRQIIRFLLITAQRSGDALGMTAREVNGDLWEIPAERYKGQRPHIVPLTGLAIAHLPLHVKNPAEEPVHRLLASDLMRRITRDWPGGRATPHDLRRTAQTHMGRLGISRFIRDRVIGHADTKLGATYDRWEYLAEKRAALETWSEWLADALGIHH